MYKSIFLKENEKDIFKSLKDQGIKTEIFEHHLGNLFNRIYNNFVGYYIFRQDDIVYKIIVLPKTIEENDSAEKEFVNYLLHYYRISSKYRLDRDKKIPDSLLQLAFESNNNEDSSHNQLDEFQSHRYRAILQYIEDFFKRHKNSKRIKVDYTSQSIKHTLNLKRNIKELDKTKIHQRQNRDIAFSLLATITFNALTLFLAHKLDDMDEELKKELTYEVKKLKSRLLKKYSIERGYKLTVATLQGVKIDRFFRKTEETRQLLVDIKSLFGFEQMYSDDAIKINHRQDLTTTSLFINPHNFYEWYVYDILKKYTDANSKSIEFDKKEGTAINYLLNEKNKSSNPDYIVTDESKKIKIVLDAKWKNVNEFGDVKPSDYLKLKFDASLIGTKEYGICSYLIYPHIAIDENSFDIFVEDESIFNFNTIEIDMEFEKHHDILSFDFDTKKLEKSIEENSQVEQLKSLSEELNHNIAISRTSTISKLIDEEDNELKDILKFELDTKLIESAFVLSEQLEEKILLPEIEEILERYEDVLEDESKKFLKSSSAIYSHYKDKEYKHFDYSMPASGFWKLIELELNTSFVWYLRILHNVCNNKSPWVKICKPNTRIEQSLDSGKRVTLTQVDKQDKKILQSVMFGGIKLLLEDQTTLEEFNTFFKQHNNEEYFIKNDLPKLVDKVTIFRNEHAHIKAMSLSKFKELWELLFDKNDNDVTALEKIIVFKKKFILFYKLQNRRRELV